jgi:RNA polymerase sigma-70 factor (ECF subfamily)
MDMSQSTNDAERVERFLALLKPIEGDLERYCRRLIWEPQELSDALQNAVTKAFAAFDRYRPEASFRAWMLKILTHEAFALNRKHARIARHEFQLEPDELASLPAARTEGGQASSARPLDEILEPELIAGLKTLTDNERAVLLLRGIGELRYQEISDALGIPLGSVMGNLSRARQKMRAFLGRSEWRNTTLRNNNL